MHLQQVGRMPRPAPDKNRALILDHADNTRRFGPADIKREWALAGKAQSEACPLALQVTVARSFHSAASRARNAARPYASRRRRGRTTSAAAAHRSNSPGSAR